MISNNTKSIKWNLPAPIEEEILNGFDLLKPISAVLVRRGISSKEELEEYLYPKEPENPHLHFFELEKAVKRIKGAIKNNEKIAICGDYDADGITSTALLLRTLEYLNSKGRAVIPSRFEDGYGLNLKMVKKLAGDGISLIITVDNGVNAKEALSFSNKEGIDVIITDHHKIPKSLPLSFALIHPELTPKNSPYKSLAGVGIAYLLAMELLKGEIEKDKFKDLNDLLCIGTIADMAPLKGANLFWLKNFIPRINLTKNKGLLCLLKLAGIEDNEIGSEDIGFKIAPRINAVGRLCNPTKVINLFLENNEEKAMKLARNCDELNRDRKHLVEGIVIEACAIIDSSREKLPTFILLAQNHWHQGVIGIVAARILEKYNRPTAILTDIGNDQYTASIRSSGSFSVIKLLDFCSILFEKYGGHEYAGGFTIKSKKLGKLQDKINLYSEEWAKVHELNKSISPNAILNISDINYDLWKQLKLLEPYGIGNEKPIFLCTNCYIENQRILRGGHLKITISQNNSKINGIIWKQDNKLINTRIDLAFSIIKNDWNNNKELELDIKATRPSSNEYKLNKAGRLYKISYKNNIITIRNQEKLEIKARIMKNGKIIIKEKAEIPYIQSLFKEAMLLFGLGY